VATSGTARHDEPKPILVRLFEAVAAIMELDMGQTGLELYFADGKLRRWTERHLNQPHARLHRFDGRAAFLAKFVRDSSSRRDSAADSR
jgi:hypothetical protein